MATERKMRWDCELDGCFNVAHRLKFSAFAPALEDKEGFTDIDAVIEVNDRYLLMEWKSHDDIIPLGQQIMYERLTKGLRFVVLVVEGNAETMEVKSYVRYLNGRARDRVETDLDGLNKYIRHWRESALAG